MICEEFKGSKKGFEKENNPKALQGSLERRHKVTVFVLGTTSVVAGPSEVRENRVEKFLGEKRNCSPRALLLLSVPMWTKRIPWHKPPLDKDLTHPYGKYVAEETQFDLIQHILTSLMGNNPCL